MKGEDLPFPVRGFKVHYTDPNTGETENGMIQTYKPTEDSAPGRYSSVTHVFVVYESSCAKDWDNFQNYTAQLTPLEHLNSGWRKKLNWNMEKLIKQSKSKYAY